MKPLFVGATALAVHLAAASAAQDRASAAQAPEKYESAAVDWLGRLVITTTDKRRIVVEKVADQSRFHDPVISPDRSAVAAQALFPNCCTSYDLPLQLVVYSRARVHRFRGNGLPIFHWNFVGRSRIAYGQEPAHFGCEVRYEFREIHSERLIDTANVPQPCGQIPNPKRVKVPAWVKAVDDRR